MKISDIGIEFIKGWEQLFLHAYDDATERIVKPGDRIHGTLTIGYGHTSAAGAPRVYAGMSITEANADAILATDLAPVENAVNRLVKVELNQHQFDALGSFQFNTNWLLHQHCSLLDAVNAGNFVLADEDFMLYDRANGVELVGLNRRRAAEKQLFMETA